MSAVCRLHCRACGGHFASLEAFDHHRTGPVGNRTCSYPDDRRLVELAGTCRIADPTRPNPTVTIYGTERAQGARSYFGGIESPQAAPVGRKSGVGA